MTPKTYFLSSLDSARFEPVRRCTVHESLIFETGKRLLRASLEPGVVGQDFNRGDDITVVYLAARHEGTDVAPVREFPCFVHIAIARGDASVASPVSADALEVIGWGELYRTEADAEAHAFG